MKAIITPSGLHFERSHSGIPDIDPDQHRLVIHGLVNRPLVFTLEALHRYPMQSRIAFIECAGNSFLLNAPQPQPIGIAATHGLVGCSEWTGVRLSTLLDEAGVDPSAQWVIAEGADAAAMSRSIPLAKAMDDTLVCLYQNGERVRPSNGYPVRLLVPGFEGNMNVKWLRRLKLTASPAMTKDETSKYTILLKDGKAWQFVFPMEVKSVITRPSPGIALKGPGFYEISGLAWSGNGSIRQVDVSADGGQSWAPAALQGPILPKAPVRFRAPWQWNGGPAVLQSRANDDTGTVQPTRAASPQSAGCAASFTTTQSPAGASMRKGRRAMFMLERFAVCAVMFTAAPALAQSPAIRATDRARRYCELGHQHRPRWRRPSARRGTPRARRNRLRRQVSGLPRREWRRRSERCARRGHRLTRSRQAAAKDGGQLLALRDDVVRLRPARNAVSGTEIA